MPSSTQRALRLALVALLPVLAAAEAAAQSGQTTTLSAGPKRMKAPGLEAPDADMEAEVDESFEEEAVESEADAGEPEQQAEYELLPDTGDAPEYELLPEADAAEYELLPEAGAADLELLPEAEEAEFELLPEAGLEPAAGITSENVFPESELIAGSDEPTAESQAPAGEVVEFAEEEPAEEAEPEAGAETEGAEDPDVVVTEEEGRGPFVGDYTLGDPEAPVQVIEYASFTCPHCAAYHQESWEELKADFVDTGKVGFTLREVYFDRFGLWASMTARCGGEAGFYPMADHFLMKQSDWTGAPDIAGAIAKIGRLNGLTDAELKACLENQEFAQLLVEEYQANAEADGVSSTPTFVIRGPDGEQVVIGNKPDEVRAAIEAAAGGS